MTAEITIDCERPDGEHSTISLTLDGTPLAADDVADALALVPDGAIILDMEVETDATPAT